MADLGSGLSKIFTALAGDWQKCLTAIRNLPG